ncbi:MAG: thiamine diphosphokinase [Saccharofermentanales bacterium]
MLGLISLGGHCIYNEKLKEICAKAEFVVAADGGMKHLAALGIRPDILVGDMDSISGTLLMNVQSDPGIEVVRYDTRKNMTDSEIAVQNAISHACSSLLLIGASGSRPDHVLSNQMMAASIAQKGIPCILTDGITSIFTVTAENSPFRYPLQGLRVDADVISIIPVIGDARNLSIRNLEYPLPEPFLAFGSTRAVSNTICGSSGTGEEYAEISLDSGVVFFVHTPNDSID